MEILFLVDSLRKLFSPLNIKLPLSKLVLWKNKVSKLVTYKKIILEAIVRGKQCIAQCENMLFNTRNDFMLLIIGHVLKNIPKGNDNSRCNKRNQYTWSSVDDFYNIQILVTSKIVTVNESSRDHLDVFGIGAFEQCHFIKAIS